MYANDLIVLLELAYIRDRYERPERMDYVGDVRQVITVNDASSWGVGWFESARLLGTAQRTYITVFRPVRWFSTETAKYWDGQHDARTLTNRI